MSRTSLGLITSGVLNGGAKKALHWITGGLIRIGVVKVVDGGLVLIGRPVDHADLVGNAAFTTLVGAPYYMQPIAGAAMVTEFVGSTPDMVLVGDASDEPIYTIVGRPAVDLVISAEHESLQLIGSPTDIDVLTGDQNDIEIG